MEKQKKIPTDIYFVEVICNFELEATYRFPRNVWKAQHLECEIMSVANT